MWDFSAACLVPCGIPHFCRPIKMWMTLRGYLVCALWGKKAWESHAARECYVTIVVLVLRGRLHKWRIGMKNAWALWVRGNFMIGKILAIILQKQFWQLENRKISLIYWWSLRHQILVEKCDFARKFKCLFTENHLVITEMKYMCTDSLNLLHNTIWTKVKCFIYGNDKLLK